MAAFHDFLCDGVHPVMSVRILQECWPVDMVLDGHFFLAWILAGLQLFIQGDQSMLCPVEVVWVGCRFMSTWWSCRHDGVDHYRVTIVRGWVAVRDCER